MAARSKAGGRWAEILRSLQAELPGEWSRRGGGLQTKLIREPIGWAIPWIGCSKASSVRLHAGVAPTVNADLSWTMGVYGMDMGDVPRGPRSIELGDAGDLDIARGFATHALTRIDELTPQRYIEWAERALDAFGGQTLPSNYLLMAPGWRVVNDSGDPVAAAEVCIDWAERRWPGSAEVVSTHRRFYEGLIDAWRTGERERALTFMTDNRDRQLAEQGYDNPQFD